MLLLWVLSSFSDICKLLLACPTIAVLEAWSNSVSFEHTMTSAVFGRSNTQLTRQMNYWALVFADLGKWSCAHSSNSHVWRAAMVPWWFLNAALLLEVYLPLLDISAVVSSNFTGTGQIYEHDLHCAHLYALAENASPGSYSPLLLLVVARCRYS